MIFITLIVFYFTTTQLTFSGLNLNASPLDILNSNKTDLVVAKNLLCDEHYCKISYDVQKYNPNKDTVSVTPGNLLNDKPSNINDLLSKPNDPNVISQSEKISVDKDGNAVIHDNQIEQGNFFKVKKIVDKKGTRYVMVNEPTLKRTDETMSNVRTGNVNVMTDDKVVKVNTNNGLGEKIDKVEKNTRIDTPNKVLLNKTSVVKDNHRLGSNAVKGTETLVLDKVPRINPDGTISKKLRRDKLFRKVERVAVKPNKLYGNGVLSTKANVLNRKYRRRGLNPYEVKEEEIREFGFNDFDTYPTNNNPLYNENPLYPVQDNSLPGAFDRFLNLPGYNLNNLPLQRLPNRGIENAPFRTPPEILDEANLLTDTSKIFIE